MVQLVFTLQPLTLGLPTLASLAILLECESAKVVHIEDTEMLPFDNDAGRFARVKDQAFGMSDVEAQSVIQEKIERPEWRLMERVLDVNGVHLSLTYLVGLSKTR